LAPPVNRREVIAASTTALFLDSGIASPIEIMTIGIVGVACWAARAAGEPRRPQADRRHGDVSNAGAAIALGDLEK
jgi:hypothetical protein